MRNLIAALLLGAAGISAGTQMANDAKVASIAMNGTGEAFVYLSSASGAAHPNLGACYGQGWVFVPDAKILSVLLTAKTMESPLARAWVKDDDTHRVLENVGFTPCKLVSLQM